MIQSSKPVSATAYPLCWVFQPVNEWTECFSVCNLDSLMNRFLFILFFLVAVVVGCKSSDTDNPLSAADELETHGSILEYLVGVYVTESVYNTQTLSGEQGTPGTDPPYSTIKSTYILTIAHKGTDSLSVTIQGQGLLGAIPLVAGGAFRPKIETSSSSHDDITMMNKRGSGWHISRVKDSDKTRYHTDQFSLYESTIQIGRVNFIRVSPGVVRN